ncbi:hypothetical protein VLK31_22830 [Variovorax sp. H27-G14]|uniref:hypothetical protein n=1 Tax=Variovorax sp. H27-G14 TaxID=3111914 RepID=UPI0038FBFAF1
MYLNLERLANPMRIVYTLRDELKAKPEYVAQVQAMTLNLEKPFLGLRGTHGLFGSDAWWESIRVGRIKMKVIAGEITEMFFAGQDSRWAAQVNSFRLKQTDGSTVEESIYAGRKSDRRLFVVGATVSTAYVMDELKRPDRDGATSYSKSVLEMAVSPPPRAR